jgi:methylenetetrahydrofolate dehydrogenase (NADP+)/methenyltetrahydrofolate cyclohydrolase
MLVDGKQMAADILAAVAQEVLLCAKQPRMTAITCAPNFETQKYLEMKKKKAASVGVALNILELSADATTESVLASVREVAECSDGIVIQLPLPEQIDREEVLSAVPPEKDPDGFAYGVHTQACMSPVVGAIDEISSLHQVQWEDRQVVVLGNGRLVGEPASHYARAKGAHVTVLIKETFDESVVRAADIIISGIGNPHFITADMIKEGSVIFDAGTSEDGGVLVGDVSLGAQAKASLVTPVPGGIGPMTIAILLRNLVTLARQ